MILLDSEELEHSHLALRKIKAVLENGAKTDSERLLEIQHIISVWYGKVGKLLAAAQGDGVHE